MTETKIKLEEKDKVRFGDLTVGDFFCVVHPDYSDELFLKVRDEEEKNSFSFMGRELLSFPNDEPVIPYQEIKISAKPH